MNIRNFKFVHKSIRFFTGLQIKRKYEFRLNSLERPFKRFKHFIVSVLLFSQKYKQDQIRRKLKDN